MAKAVALIASALCLLAVAAIADNNADLTNADVFQIEGSVYCDTCRVQFENPLSKRMKDVKVELKCRDPVSQQVKYETSAVSNATGGYVIQVNGDHEEEICEVSVPESPDANCNVPMEDLTSARVDLALNDGIHQSTRYPSAIGFMVKEALPECKKMLDEMGIVIPELGN